MFSIFEIYKRETHFCTVLDSETIVANVGKVLGNFDETCVFVDVGQIRRLCFDFDLKIQEVDKNVKFLRRSQKM